MKKETIILLIFISVFSVLKLKAETNKLDSVKLEYNQTQQDSVRIQLLLEIGDGYINQIPDTALFYYESALKLSDQILNTLSSDKTISNNFQSKILSYKSRSYQAIGKIFINQGNYDKAMESFVTAREIDEKSGNEKSLSACYINIGVIHMNKGEFDKAIDSYLNSYKISEESGDKEGMANCYNNMGIVYQNKGNFDKALENYLLALKISEEMDNKAGMTRGYNNVGVVYWYQGNYDKALENFSNALIVYKELGHKKEMAQCYMNIGVAHNIQGHYDIAIENYKQSLKIAEEIGDKKGMASCYNNLGSIHANHGRYSKAIENNKKSLKIFEELNDKKNIAILYANIASLYTNLADTCKKKDNKKKIAYLNQAKGNGIKAYNLAFDIGALPLQNEIAKSLQGIFSNLGNYKEALKYAEIYIATKDSMFSEEKTKALTEMTTKYEAEKKQLQIEKMEKQKELDDKTIEAQKAKNRKQQIIIFSAVGGFITVLIFSFIILRMFRQKRTANLLLAKQNDEINQQKEQIEEQNQNITDSIVYAQRIQRALLPPGDYIKQLLPYRFVFYKPRDIVSGDFYWVSKKDGIIITAAADCTGHGVPGAMMSMLGVSILNEVVNSNNKEDAGEILNNFRNKLIESLHQGGQETEMWDGIDIALCLINIEKQIVQYSGAYSPLYLIREGNLLETKGNKMPIGIHARMEPFTNHKIKIQAGDMLYIFSDGYIDQFGGQNDKRFTQRRFKKLLTDIHNKSMPEQKEELEKNLKEWQGNSNQIDDILVMGVRV